MKFKVGDHVEVVGYNWPEQVGLTGTVKIADIASSLPFTIVYDYEHPDHGQFNSYYEEDLQLSIIGKSPLYQALA